MKNICNYILFNELVYNDCENPARVCKFNNQYTNLSFTIKYMCNTALKMNYHNYVNNLKLSSLTKTTLIVLAT